MATKRKPAAKTVPEEKKVVEPVAEETPKVKPKRTRTKAKPVVIEKILEEAQTQPTTTTGVFPPDASDITEQSIETADTEVKPEEGKTHFAPLFPCVSDDDVVMDQLTGKDISTLEITFLGKPYSFETCFIAGGYTVDLIQISNNQKWLDEGIIRLDDTLDPNVFIGAVQIELNGVVKSISLDPSEHAFKADPYPADPSYMTLDTSIVYKENNVSYVIELKGVLDIDTKTCYVDCYGIKGMKVLGYFLGARRVVKSQ